MEYSSTKKARLPGISFDFGSDDDDDDDVDDGVTPRAAAAIDEGPTTVVSPTTRRLHETANALVDSTEETAVERAEDVVASVVGGVIRAFKSSSSPWRRERGVEGGAEVGGGSGRADDDVDSDDDEDEEDGGSEAAGGGEQTAILDAAAAYMARMESLYVVDVVDGDDYDDIIQHGAMAMGAEGVKAGAPDAAAEDGAGDQDADVDEGLAADDDDDGSVIFDAGRRSATTQEFQNFYTVHDSNDDDKFDGSCCNENKSSSIASNESSGGGSSGHRRLDHRRDITSKENVVNYVQDDAADDDVDQCSASVSSPDLTTCNAMMDDSISFYIGINDGFRASLSIHESDISETASETCHDDDDIDDDDTIFDEETIGGDEVMAEMNDGRDDDEYESLGVPPPPPPPPPCFPPPPQPKAIICAEDYADRSAPAVLAPASSNDVVESLHGTRDVASTMTPTRSFAEANSRQSPRYTGDSLRHDYVPTTLKRMLHRQESELMRFMSSVDALSSTPERIANRLLKEDDDDDDVDDDVDLLVEVDDGGGGFCSGTLFSAVKRRLIPDGDTSTNMTSAKSRRRIEKSSSSEGGGRSLSETQKKSANSVPGNVESSSSAEFMLALLPLSLSQTRPVTTSEDWHHSEGVQVNDSMLPPPYKEVPPPQKEYICRSALVRSDTSSSGDFVLYKPDAAAAKKAVGDDVGDMLCRQTTVVESREESASSLEALVAQQRGDNDFATDSKKRHAVMDKESLLALAATDEDDDEDDGVPNYMKQLFRDADSLLQTALASSPYELAVDERGLGNISDDDGDGILLFDDDVIASRSGMLATAEGSHMSTAAECNDVERVERKARLAAAETSNQDGQDFFASQGDEKGCIFAERVEKKELALEEANAIQSELDNIERDGAVLERNLAEMGLLAETERVEKEYNCGENSLLNDTFDTAFCSLGAIERAVDDYSDTKGRMGYENACSTAAQDFIHPQFPQGNVDPGSPSGSSVVVEVSTKTLGHDAVRGIANVSEEQDPPETSKTTSANERSLKVRKARCNVPRNRKNGGKKGNSSALASALIEYDESQKSNDCDATKETGSLNDNDSEGFVTSSSINEVRHNVFPEPAESFETSCLEQAPEAGTGKSNEEVIPKIAEASTAVSQTSSDEKSSSDCGGKLTFELAVKTVDNAAILGVGTMPTGSSNQVGIADVSHDNTSEVDAGIRSLDYLNEIEDVVHVTDTDTDGFEKSTLEEAKEPSPTGYDGQLQDYKISVELLSEAESDPIQYSQGLPVIGEDSRPSSTAAEKSNLDESMFNESMFMPNLSIDIANSPESKYVSTAVEPMPAMSEDESEGNHDDEDDEAFFPNPDHSTKLKEISGANKPRAENERKYHASLEHPLRGSYSLIGTSHVAHGKELAPETKPVAPHHSMPSPLRANTPRSVRSLTRKTVAADQCVADPTSSGLSGTVKDGNVQATSKPSSSTEMNQHHKVSIATLKRCGQLSSSTQRSNRKTAPLWSPPSAIKPAKKRSKTAAPVTSAPAEEGGENKTPDNQLSEVAPAPFQAEKPLIREIRGKSSNFKVKSTGKENNKDELIAKGKQTAEMKQAIDTASSRSMKQSLVSITRDRRQSETNIQAPSLGRNSKKVVDMARLDRLARPKMRQSMIPLVDPGPDNNAKKKETRAVGPPSFLSRPVTSSHVIKSTAELEKEEMERIKPFKAQRILGSSAEVKSRFNRATLRIHAPTQAAVPSSSGQSKSKLKPPARARPPSSISRETGLYKPTSKRERVSTFGESIQHYLNHGLRGSSPTSKKALALTPKPPTLLLRRQTLSHAAKAKSSEEIELDECRKQFRARTIGSTCHSPALKMTTPQLERPRMLTTPSPFRLHTDMRAACIRPPQPSTDDLELSKKFKALPLPNSSTRFSKADIGTAQKHIAVARQRSLRLNAGEGDGMFKAKPVPKTTYIVAAIKKTTQVLTQPNPPRLSLTGRAEARKLFDHHQHEMRNADNAMKKMKERQKKDMEEEDIRRQRRIYADDGGFCFKATPISIEYI